MADDCSQQQDDGHKLCLDANENAYGPAIDPEALDFEPQSCLDSAGNWEPILRILNRYPDP